MKEKVRVMCGATYDDYEVKMKITSQFRLSEVPMDLSGIPYDDGGKYYVKIDNNFNVTKYISENGKLYQIMSEL